MMVRLANRVPPWVASLLKSQALGTRALRPLVNALLPDSPQIAVVRSGAAAGLRLMLEPKREKFYWTGNHEPAVQHALTSLLKPGMAFWDVGAHIGFFTLIASRLVGPSGEVHAFEPMRQNIARLHSNLGLNRMQNVTIHEVALSDRVGKAQIHERGSDLQWSLIPADTTTGSVKVRCSTLDAIDERGRVPVVVKVDVEGAESAVLRGGARFIARHRPILIIEFLKEGSRESAASMLPNYQFQFLDNCNWLAVPAEL